MTTRIVVESSKRHSMSADLSGPGGHMRFGVEEAGTARSAVWRVWSNKNNGDIYVASRAIAGLQKISLHDGGDWRFHWTSPKVARRYAPGAPHPLDRWARPQETEVGWTRALSILIAEEDLIEHPYLEDESKPIAWAPLPSSGRLAAFHIFISRPNRGIVEMKGFLPMGGYSLATGESCLLFYATHHPPPDRREALEEHRRGLTTHAKAHGVSSSDSLRGMLAGTGDNGRPMIFDLALSRPAIDGNANESQGEWRLA